MNGSTDASSSDGPRKLFLLLVLFTARECLLANEPSVFLLRKKKEVCPSVLCTARVLLLACGRTSPVNLERIYCIN